MLLYIYINMRFCVLRTCLFKVGVGKDGFSKAFYVKLYITFISETLYRRQCQMAEYKNRIAVDIYDQQYTLVGAENPEHMRYVARLVDEKIREIGVRNAGLDTTRKAVLAAVNVMDDYVKLQEKYDSAIRELEQKGN